MHNQQATSFAAHHTVRRPDRGRTSQNNRPRRRARRPPDHTMVNRFADDESRPPRSWPVQRHIQRNRPPPLCKGGTHKATHCRLSTQCQALPHTAHAPWYNGVPPQTPSDHSPKGAYARTTFPVITFNGRKQLRQSRMHSRGRPRDGVMSPRPQPAHSFLQTTSTNDTYCTHHQGPWPANDPTQAFQANFTKTVGEPSPLQ